ncbi:MAG: ATP-binding cassette domain-containing protein [Elusimicrobia bacterium]|nr:ATP-binding cassette domain-containing protein [Elusimicrobiota bacterium]
MDLDIPDGQTITIIGGSGTGKSVTLKIMVGLLKPEKGQVLVDGADVAEAASEEELFETQSKFGFLFQGAALFDSLTVGENVAFGIRNLKKDIPDSRVRKIVSEKLDLVGLSGVESLKPAELSGGMKKRVGLARAIAHEPKYIVYDEPTTGLDPITADVINELIVDIQKKLNVTSIVVTHDMVSAYKISNQIAMIYEGKIISTGTPGEIKNSSNPYVRQFVTGSSQGPIKVKLREWE